MRRQISEREAQASACAQARLLARRVLIACRATAPLRNCTDGTDA
jgi:hypothetical protein